MDLIKGTDNTIEITLRDSLGVAIDISTLNGAIVKVFQKGILFQQFSLNTQPNYTDIEIFDGPNGVIRVHVDADNTRTGINKKDIFVEVKTEIVDANFAGGLNTTSHKPVKIGELIDSEIKNDSF